MGEKWRSRCENRGKLKANKVEYGGEWERESGRAEEEWKEKRKVNPFGGSECTRTRKHETRHFYWYYSRVSSRFRGRTSISSSILNEIAARCVKSITGSSCTVTILIFLFNRVCASTGASVQCRWSCSVA